jgi:hypothetical protein
MQEKTGISTEQNHRSKAEDVARVAESLPSKLKP